MPSSANVAACGNCRWVADLPVVHVVSV